MHVYDEITWEQFQQKFFEAFGREMNADEHQWFHAIWSAATRATHAKSKGAAA